MTSGRVVLIHPVTSGTGVYIVLFFRYWYIYVFRHCLCSWLYRLAWRMPGDLCIYAPVKFLYGFFVVKISQLGKRVVIHFFVLVHCFNPYDETVTFSLLLK